MSQRLLWVYINLIGSLQQHREVSTTLSASPSAHCGSERGTHPFSKKAEAPRSNRGPFYSQAPVLYLCLSVCGSPNPRNRSRAESSPRPPSQAPRSPSPSPRSSPLSSSSFWSSFHFLHLSLLRHLLPPLLSSSSFGTGAAFILFKNGTNGEGRR